MRRGDDVQSSSGSTWPPPAPSERDAGARAAHGRLEGRPRLDERPVVLEECGRVLQPALLLAQPEAAQPREDVGRAEALPGEVGPAAAPQQVLERRRADRLPGPPPLLVIPFHWPWQGALHRGGGGREVVHCAAAVEGQLPELSAGRGVSGPEQRLGVVPVEQVQADRAAFPEHEVFASARQAGHLPVWVQLQVPVRLLRPERCPVEHVHLELRQVLAASVGPLQLPIQPQRPSRPG
eukprot:CAMPEP_0171211262 /NCGR_PEP_ID=MMETSP0790-20130122/29535_1 /TAXON_ID=2925 /ORGANISM="Alexandrium catenella, Strain OF101" /LENGTH=236 /DNA_ID=CAMNT_0011676927 /DNA_START=14 /DNA_END=720 /DNA_ORIENTATION=+